MMIIAAFVDIVHSSNGTTQRAADDTGWRMITQNVQEQPKKGRRRRRVPQSSLHI